MRNFLLGFVDHWRVALLYRNRINYVASRAYHAGHVAGAVSYHVALLSVAFGLGTVVYYWAF